MMIQEWINSIIIRKKCQANRLLGSIEVKLIASLQDKIHKTRIC